MLGFHAASVRQLGSFLLWPLPTVLRDLLLLHKIASHLGTRRAPSQRASEPAVLNLDLTHLSGLFNSELGFEHHRHLMGPAPCPEDAVALAFGFALSCGPQA